MTRKEKYQYLRDKGISGYRIARLYDVPESAVYNCIGPVGDNEPSPRSNVDNVLSRAFRIVFGFDPIRDGNPQYD